MPQEKLDLFEFSSSLMAEPRSGSTQIMWSYYADAAVYGRFTNDGPNYLRREPPTLNLSGHAYGAEENSIL